MSFPLGEAALPQRAARSAATARILPFALYMAFLALGQLLQSLAPVVDWRWWYVLQIGAALLVMAAYARSYVELADIAGFGWPAGLRAVGVGAAAFVAWIALDLPWAGGGDSAGFEATKGDGSIDWMLVGLRLFGAAAVVPLMEELFWRSFILRWIERRDFLYQVPATVGLRALVLSSLLFGLEHELWLAGIVAGLAYGGLYMRSGNLWSPVVAHATTNLLLGVWVVATASWRYW